MKLINMDENCPKVFYVFIGLGNSIYSKINYHNYKLNNSLISGGFKNLEISNIDINDFIMGNITYAPFIPNSTTFLSPTSHLMNVINSYQVEYILEFYRKQEYPSRFSCLYAFGDYESCEKASRLYPKMFDLSKVKKFKLKITNTDLDKCIKVAKCNMEIVTRMWNCDISSFDKNSISRISYAYWNGTGQVATERQNIEDGLYSQTISDVLYEYLIEGILEEVD
ncbi:MAG: hypothetical protein Q4E39_01400 [bacterium]|nr:hypothetical protein [bacterium]